MNRHDRPARAVRWVICCLLATAWLATGSLAHAQNRNRRMSGAQRAAMQKAQQQMEAYQKDMARYQREVAEKNAEIAKQFDENGDGRLFGAEKSKYDKHMREIQTGKKPNPFASILPPGQGPEMFAAKKK